MDRVVLVTGGSRGIGFVTCKTFLENGDKIAFFSVNKESVSKAKEELSKAGAVFADAVDVTDYEAVSDFILQTIDHFGKVDILVNNAGILSTGSFAEQEKESIDHLVAVNLNGVLYTTQAVLPYMLNKKNGIIVNISSGAGQTGFANLAVYSATKFAVVGFTEALAKEVDRHGVKVYAVCPGTTATDMVGGVGRPPQAVAEKILAVSGPNPPISPGNCLEAY